VRRRVLGKRSRRVVNRIAAENEKLLDPAGAYLAGEVVLVTGAGGSIGAELCRQISRVGPRKLILVDHAEDNLFEILRELQEDRHVNMATPVLAEKGIALHTFFNVEAIDPTRKVVQSLEGEELAVDVVFAPAAPERHHYRAEAGHHQEEREEVEKTEYVDARHAPAAATFFDDAARTGLPFVAPARAPFNTPASIPARCSLAAPMKSRNSGCGRSGRERNCGLMEDTETSGSEPPNWRHRSNAICDAYTGSSTRVRGQAPCSP